MSKVTFEKTSKERVCFSAPMKFDAVTAADGRKVLRGLAIVYGQLSDDRGGYFVRIAPGAARFAVPTLAIYNHDYQHVLGNTSNNTLSITDTAEGVIVEILLPNTTLGNDTYTLVKDRYVAGMSFGTIPTKTREIVEDGKTVVVYEEMYVDEVTITVIPSFTQTTIEAVPEASPVVVEAVTEEVAPVDAEIYEGDELELATMRATLYRIASYETD